MSAGLSGGIIIRDKAMRMKICNDCPHLKRKLSQCELCHCFMKLKTKLPKARCPIGKW